MVFKVKAGISILEDVRKSILFEEANKDVDALIDDETKFDDDYVLRSFIEEDEELDDSIDILADSEWNDENSLSEQFGKLESAFEIILKK